MAESHPMPGCCPFCRSDHCSAFECDVGRWAVTCPSCGAIGPAAASVVEAVSRWAVAAVAGAASR